jgi:hypothetical protein
MQHLPDTGRRGNMIMIEIRSLEVFQAELNWETLAKRERREACHTRVFGIVLRCGERRLLWYRFA